GRLAWWSSMTTAWACHRAGGPVASGAAPARRSGGLAWSRLNRRRVWRAFRRQRRVERQVDRRLAAAVPGTGWHPGREHHQRTGGALVLLPVDLDAHRAAQHVEDLVDRVGVEAAWRAPAGRRLDVADRTGLGPGFRVEQPLVDALISTTVGNGGEIGFANV